MPSITIREKDLTSAGNLEVTTNAVYIPGYAYVGPINKPVLCSTLEEFQQIFGIQPYVFKEDQEWPEKFDSDAKPSTKFYYAGEQEKSYIMACELLNLGLPVLYERVANFSDKRVLVGKSGKLFLQGDASYQFSVVKDGSTGKDIIISNDTGAFIDEHVESKSTEYIWTAKHVVTDVLSVVATSTGRLGGNIYYSIVSETIDGNTAYLIRVGRTENVSCGASAVDVVATRVTFSRELNRDYPSIKLITKNVEFTDESGLVKIVPMSDQLPVVQPDSDGKVTSTQLQFPEPSMIENIDEFSVQNMYDYISLTGTDLDGNSQGYDRLIDNGEYVIKFITSGAYPTFEYNGSSIASTMLLTAAVKGNCTALIDHTPNNERPLSAINDTSVYYAVAHDWGKTTRKNALGEDASTYSAMFTPYGIYECTSVGKDVMLPASFGYLAAYAAQIQYYNSWLATAGVTRGLVPNLKSLCQNITNAVADSYQPRDGIAINAITNIKPYGLAIWGARTLKDNAKKGDLTATSFLNIRQLTNDVKRTTWVSAKILTYEQNNDMLWLKFKLNITPLLNEMISGSAISSYEFKRVPTTKKATVNAKIRLYAIEPVEDWDITIELADGATEILG